MDSQVLSAILLFKRALDLLILEHTRNGRIHVLDVNILAILTESNPKPIRRRIDWLGHATHGIKLTRTVDGRGLLSRGASGDSIAWGLDNSGLIEQRAIVPFEQTCLSVTLIAGNNNSLHLFADRDKVNIVWRCIRMSSNCFVHDRLLQRNCIPSMSKRLGLSCVSSSSREPQMKETFESFSQSQMLMNLLLGQLILRVRGQMERLRTNLKLNWSVAGGFLPWTIFTSSLLLILWDGVR